MGNHHPRLALVTGASSGIGEAFACLLAARGCDLVVTARREDRLQALKARLESAHHCSVHVIPMDLSAPDSAEKLHQATQDLGLEVDTLINNAGYGIPQKFAETSWSDQARFIQVMAITPTRLARLYLPSMLERGDGRILNMASFSSFFPASPFLTLYSPLKHYVLAFSQSLAVETEGSGVTVTAVCPGPTETEWIDNTRTRGFVEGLPKFMVMSADEVARQGYRGMLTGKRCVVPGIGIKITVLMAKLLPASVMIWFLRRAFS